MAQNKKPLVAVIGCGGTISTIAQSKLDFIDYPETGRKLDIEEVMENMPDLHKVADIIQVPFREVGSSAIGPQEWVELCKKIIELERNNTDLKGVVIFHGTATLEETAYFLSLVLKTRLPVVLTGAQRPLNALGSDATINALSALRVAVDKGTRGKGVLVVLNDEIHAAREVTKTSTYRLHAFQTPEFGPIGVVDADCVSYFRSLTRPHTVDSPFKLEEKDELPRVDILYSYAGADDTAVNAYIASGAQGIVSAGFAPGIPSPKERAALEEASKYGLVIVQSTRVGSGRVAGRQYLRKYGWVGANNLSPQKARILLMLSLMETRDPKRVQYYFDGF